MSSVSCAVPSFGTITGRRARQKLPTRPRHSPLPRRLPRQHDPCPPAASALDLLDVAAAANAGRNVVVEGARFDDDDEDDDDDDGAGASGRELSIADSTDDVFSEYCQAQVELVAHALGRGARCRLYLRSQAGVEGSLQLAEVASYPPSSSTSSSPSLGWSGAAAGDDDEDEYESGDDTTEVAAAAAAAESFAFVEEERKQTTTERRPGGGGGAGAGRIGGQAITLSGLGSVDDADGNGGQKTAAEATLVKQRIFALPSTNALVVPLSRDNTLVGLLVGEMPEGGGWRRRRSSARMRAKRERAKVSGGATPGEVEVEVLSAAAATGVGANGGGDEEGRSSSSSSSSSSEAAAANTAEQFGDRRQAALSSAARAIVAAWAMHRRANYAAAAAVRSDRRVAGFTYAAREPLTVLRTLGGMLSSHLKKDTPSRDMADAIVAQGDVLASLSEELESALYPQQMIEELTAGKIGAGGAVGGVMEGRGARGGGGGGGAIGVVDSDGSVRGLSPSSPGVLKQLPGAAAAAAAAGGDSSLQSSEGAMTAPSAPPEAVKTATAKAIASGVSPCCDVTPIVGGLLASGEVMAKPAGVTMTATFPEPPTRALARADPRDVRETLALVIDAALLAAPKGAKVDVVVSANGGSKGGVVVKTTVTAGAGTSAAVGLAVELPAGALARAAGSAAAEASPGMEPTPGRSGPGSGSELGSTASGVAAGAEAHEGTPLSWGAMGETQSLKIARSLVEGAGGIFHVLPSLPPTVGRIELWLPAGGG